MTVRPELIDELLTEYRNPAALIGKEGMTIAYPLQPHCAIAACYGSTCFDPVHPIDNAI